MQDSTSSTKEVNLSATVVRRRGRPLGSRVIKENGKKRVISPGYDKDEWTSDSDDDLINFKRRLEEDTEKEMDVSIKVTELEKELSKVSEIVSKQKDFMSTFVDHTINMRNKFILHVDELKKQLEESKEKLKENERKYQEKLSFLNGKIIDYDAKFTRIEARYSELEMKFRNSSPPTPNTNTNNFSKSNTNTYPSTNTNTYQIPNADILQQIAQHKVT